MSFESRLRKETARWVADGIVSPEQAARIEARHPESEGGAASRFLSIISVLGAVLCAVGLALIISANWQDIHRWVKIGALVSLLAAANGTGWWLLHHRDDRARIGEALLIAGAVLFLLGIGLVGQIYHLAGRPGDPVLLWIAGIAPLPFLARSRGTFFVLLVATYLWLAIEASVRDGWLNFAASEHHSGEVSLPLVLLCGSLIFYWTAFFWRPAWESFARIQQAWPVALIGVTVYAAGFAHKDWWGHREPLHGTATLLLIGVVAISAVAAAIRGWHAWRMLSPWLILAGGSAMLALGNLLGNDVRIAASVLSWVTLVVLNVFMVRAGLAQGRPWLVNLAIGFIALNLFTRYFDIFGSMFDQGLMFLVSGAVVLGLGWYLERKRRALLGAMRQGGGNA